MGQPIRRATLGAMAKEYEARGQVAPWNEGAPQQFNPGAVFFGVYVPQITTERVIQPGDELFPYAFYPPTISYQNAVKKLWRNKLKVAVDFSRAADENPLVAITGAKQNHVCQFFALDGQLYFGHITVPDASVTYDYVDENGVATNTEEDAFADLLFRTSAYQGRAVALCEKIGGGGLTLEEVDDEIDGKSANLTRASKTVMTDAYFTVSNGYLVLNRSTSSMTYLDGTTGS